MPLVQYPSEEDVTIPLLQLGQGPAQSGIFKVQWRADLLGIVLYRDPRESVPIIGESFAVPDLSAALQDLRFSSAVRKSQVFGELVFYHVCLCLYHRSKIAWQYPSVQSEFLKFRPSGGPRHLKVSANNKRPMLRFAQHRPLRSHLKYLTFFVVHSKRENPLLFCQKVGSLFTSTEMIPGCRP